MRVPFTTRSKKVVSSVTDPFAQPTDETPPPLIQGKVLERAASQSEVAESSGVRAKFVLASLTRFHSRPPIHSTAGTSSVYGKKSTTIDLKPSLVLNLPSIGTSEQGSCARTKATSTMVTSQATATLSILNPPSSSSGQLLPGHDGTGKRQPRGLVGLQNLGNTCFMNSCLQCVSNLPALVMYFHQGLYTHEINGSSGTRGALANAFGDLMTALWTGDKFTVTRPIELKRVIGKVASQFTGYDQQDAQEFLRFLLDGLHEDLNHVNEKPAYYEIEDRPEAKDRDVSDKYWKFYCERNISALSELFCGQLRSEIRCETCKHRSLCFDIFWDLSVPVPKQVEKMRLSGGFLSGIRPVSATKGATTSAHTGVMSIYDCLKAYTEQEILCDKAAYYCTKCKMHRSVAKKISIYRLPNVLVLHLKRFTYSTFSRDKVNTNISFPSQSLDIADYCAIDAIVDGSTLYDLTGIVHHTGSLLGGHYTAECLNADTQEWFAFNDASVTAIEKPELCSSRAYMLFYQRRQEKSLAI